MDPIAIQAMIKLKEHYENLLSKQKAELDREKKKVNMYSKMVNKHSDICFVIQPGDCVLCGVMCYRVEREVIDHENGDTVNFNDERNYEVCCECNELTCDHCHQYKLGLLYSFPWERELNKCTKCKI